MRPRPFLLGNWKMNHSIAEGRAFAAAYLRAVPTRPRAFDVGIAPPATALWALTEGGLGDHIFLTGQDAFAEEAGAFTGAISASQLKDAGARWLMLGHSERRKHFHETDAGVFRRATLANKVGLSCVLCVGETLQEREAGQSTRVLQQQIEAVLPALPHERSGFRIAYEPVWAIGGRAAHIDDIARAHEAIRAVLQRHLATEIAASVPIAYGGGVQPGDVETIARHPAVDGLLVGGASLSAPSFVTIVAAMQRAVQSEIS